ERRLHREPLGTRNIVERGATLELVDNFGGFGLEAFGDLILAPFLLDTATLLLERALARGLHVHDLEPDVAASRHLDGLVLDAHVGAERRAGHVDARQAGDLIAAGIAALPVDCLDGAGGEPELLR